MRSSSAWLVSVALSAAALAAVPGGPDGSSRTPDARAAQAPAAADTGLARVLRGRVLTINHACGGCHGGGANPAAEGFLAGMRTPDQEFLIGPCAMQPGASRPVSQKKLK